VRERMVKVEEYSIQDSNNDRNSSLFNTTTDTNEHLINRNNNNNLKSSLLIINKSDIIIEDQSKSIIDDTFTTIPLNDNNPEENEIIGINGLPININEILSNFETIRNEVMNHSHVTKYHRRLILGLYIKNLHIIFTLR
jgi:hypothetical protein